MTQSSHEKVITGTTIAQYKILHAWIVRPPGFNPIPAAALRAFLPFLCYPIVNTLINVI